MIFPFPQLTKRQQHGSKPRCHLLTHGSRAEVAKRLTELVHPFARVSAEDHWMPDGFEDIEEARLDQDQSSLLVQDAAIRKQLRNWWLLEGGAKTQTPNFDIASTCTIDGKPGLLLIEAKAHDRELREAEAGKPFDAGSSNNSKANHGRIAEAIAEAAKGFKQAMAGSCGISRNLCYQMSNRFAWAWKLTELGFPVVLIYLGFLNAEEMRRSKQIPLASHKEWERLVRFQSARLFSSDPWEQDWKCNGRSFIPLIRVYDQPLDTSE